MPTVFTFLWYHIILPIRISSHYDYDHRKSRHDNFCILKNNNGTSIPSPEHHAQAEEVLKSEIKDLRVN